MADGWLGIISNPDGSQVFACPKPMCYYRVLLGEHTTADHKCPHIGQSTYGWSVTVGLVEEIWKKLDKVVDDMKHDPAPTDLAMQNLRGKAEAYAESLVLFMRPLYNSVEDISRESGRRYKARLAGDLDYETPGIRHAKYRTMMDGDVWYRGKAGGWTDDPRQAAGDPTLSDEAILNRAHGIIAVALETSPFRAGGALALQSVEEQNASTHNFTDAEVEKLKAFAAGGFTPEDLARVHNVRVEAIHAALRS